MTLQFPAMAPVMAPVMARVAILLLATVGCSDSGKVTLHQAGVYKGATDPLLAKQRTEEQQNALRKRFNLVQADR